MSNAKAGLSFIDRMYKEYHRDAGKMLIHTGTIGWVMSSMAQILGIVINDKVSKEQKMFLIPQEFMDACVNILSFYLVTRSFTGIANKLTTTGKWIPSDVKNHLIKNGFKDLIGKFNFDILKDVSLKGAPLRSFELHKNGLGLIATTIGSIISCNIITPIFRNLYASHRQRTNIARMNNPSPRIQNPQTPRDRARAVIHHTYMQAFMNRGDLKV